MERSRIAVYSAPPMAGKTGRKCCLWMKTPAARTWVWIPTIRGLCLRECGSSRFTPMGERAAAQAADCSSPPRSEEHTSELQSLTNLVCRLLLEKKKKKKKKKTKRRTRQ